MPKKKKETTCPNCAAVFRNGALLLARLIIGSVFITLAMNKLMDISSFATTLETANYIYPETLAYVAAITELVAGFSIILGLFTEVGAALLTGVMFVAIITMHNNLFTSMQGLQAALPALGFLSANMALMATGGGKWALASLHCSE